MDLISLAAVLMLVIWGVATFAFEAPGWMHLLLTLGVFLIIWRIVLRGTMARRITQRPAPDRDVEGDR